MSNIIENVTLDIDGNMWHLNNGLCIAEPTSINGFGATIQDTIDDFGKEIRPSVYGDLPLDLKPWKDELFVGINIVTSNIQRIGYSHRKNLLFIEFNNGRRYHYQDVPVEIWQEFLISPAKGATFNRIVKGYFRYYWANGD